MKHALLLSLVVSLLAAAPARAATYTWTGAAGDGLWFTAGNWALGGETATASPGNTPTDDIVIDGSGVVVSYVPGGDYMPSGTTTISGGASLVQTGGAWPYLYGDMTIDGGTWNTGDATTIRLAAALTLVNGGTLVTSGSLTKSGDAAALVLGTGSSLSLSGSYTAASVPITMRGGSLVVENEFQPASGTVFEGSGTISVNIFSPQSADSVVTFNGPNLIMRTGDFDGFWQSGGTYIDVPAGSTSKFTVYSGFKNASDVYPKTFGSSTTTPKFRYGGAVLTRAEFEQLFTVEDHGEAINGDSNYADFYLTPTAVVYPAFTAGSPAVALDSDTQATVTATVSEAGEPDAAELLLFWGTTDGGHDTNAWANVRSLGTASDSQAISEAIPLTRGSMHYVALAAVTDDLVVWATFSKNSVFALVEPGAPYNVWKATESADSRTAANWSLGHVPTADEIVFVYDNFVDRGENHMDWYPETAATVGAWEQPSNFSSDTFYVNFLTTTNSPLVITGDVSLAGGTWTHGYQREVEGVALNVSVGGDMTVGPNAFVHAGLGTDGSRPGGIPTGFQVREGPGYPGPLYGSSYAGDGGLLATSAVPAFVSYGSILDPLDYGSGGQGDSSAYAGGGIVKLTVSGGLTVNGTIASTGFGYPLGEANEFFGGSGSGGSVNLTAGTLAGTGTIAANGGPNDAPGPGAGGRVRILLTDSAASFDSFTGSIEAMGGATYDRNTYANFQGVPAAAGTVVLALGSQGVGAAKVVVDNELRGKVSGETLDWLAPPAGYEAARAGTHLPSQGPRERLQKTEWELRGHGTLRLTADLRLASLTMEDDEGANAVITDGHTLTVKTLQVGETSYRAGSYTATELPGIVLGTGSIVVDVMPMVMILL